MGVVLIIVIAIVYIFSTNSNGSNTQDVKIGVIAPLTGWAAYWGEDVKKAMDLAVEEVNANGGINGQKVVVIYEDMGPLDLKAAVNSANKLINIDKVDILFTNFLEDTSVVAPIAHKANVPILSIGAGNKGVEPKDMLFRIRPYLEGYAPEISAKYFISKGKRNPVVIYEDINYYTNYKNETVDAWKKITGKEPKSFAISGDVRDAVLKAVEAKADVMYVRAPTPSQIEVIKRLKEVAPNIAIEATEARDPAFISSGSITDGFTYLDYKLISGNTFTDEFKKKYKSQPGLPAMLGYDSVYVLVKALNGKSVNAKNILTGFKGVDFEGVSGRVQFDSDQNRVVEKDRIEIYLKNKGAFVPVTK